MTIANQKALRNFADQHERRKLTSLLIVAAIFGALAGVGIAQIVGG